MSVVDNKDFDKFTSLVGKWSHIYEWTACSYVALKTVEGVYLLCGRLLLEPSPLGYEPKPFYFESDHVQAARLIKKNEPTDIEKIIVDAKEGKITVLDRVLSLYVGQQSQLSTHFTPIFHPLLKEGPRLPSLHIRGEQRYKLLSLVGDDGSLDWELKASDTPFESLDELLSHCGLPMIRQMGDSAILEIVARAPGFITNESIIRNNRAIIKCRTAKKININEVKIGYKLIDKDTIVRANIPGNKITWQLVDDLYYGQCNIEVGEANVALIIFSYNGEALHQWWITDPDKHLNPRQAIHQLFDANQELLGKMLMKPETSKPYEFEGAVSALINLLGFSVSNYGRIPKLQRGPDIIAIAPAGHIGVIECTVGLLDENDKLAKLVQRTKLIRENLASAGYGFLQIKPIIVTPLLRAEIEANLDDARKYNIAVICKEDLDDLLKLVIVSPNPDKLFEEINRFIPGNSDDDLFSGIK